MKMGVTHKLFLAILMAASLAVISSALIVQWSLSRGFHKYVNAIEASGVSRLAGKLEERYRAEGNWNFLRTDPAKWRQLIAASLPLEVMPPRKEIPPPEGMPPLHGRIPPGAPPEFSPGEKGPPHDMLPPPLTRQFDERLYLLDSSKNVIISGVQGSFDSEATPLRHRGEIVGYLGLLPRTKSADTPQNRFLKEQELALTLTAAVVVLLSAALSLLLARRLVRPLRELTHATHQLAAGSFSVRVPITSNDELSQLASDFNSLARVLETNEQARRQWVADISHELRTPLGILRGEIEALQDGLRQPTPLTIQSLHAEVLRLGRLVDDLYQLSLSDVGALTYRKNDLVLADVLAETVEAFQPEFAGKGISLVEDMGEGIGANIFGDSERLHQLFSNLLDNSLKYTDPGGKLLVKLDRSDGVVVVDFQDSFPGVPPAALDKLFDRLYRVDTSRNRSTGGAGLGLAICRNIVDAHEGTISVQPSMMGGLWVRIEFPLKGRM
ncbi:MAG: HAMP domain-containing protein [Desulfuromonadales bacterium]|nr:HAMP domain-containing protein [Desulfuromonadales bacterium]